MKTSFLATLSLLAVLVLLGSSANAIDALEFEYVGSGAYTSNLLNDSSGVSDYYLKKSLKAKAYPSNFSEVMVKGDYTYYKDIANIRNYMLGGMVCLVPYSDTAGFATSLSLDFETRDYKSDSLNFNTTNDWTLKGGLGYQYSPSVHLRLGMSYKASIYTDSDVPDKKTLDVSSGVNWSLGSSALDLELGYSSGNISYIDSSDFLAQYPARPVRKGTEYADSVVADETLKSFYVSPRWSFRLGNKTGAKLTFSHRYFVSLAEDANVYGFTVPTLSPWGSDWEGSAITISVKTYLVPRFILTAGAGYFDKTYINVLEAVKFIPTDPPVVSMPLSIQYRDDEQTRVYLAAQMPWASRTGWFFEPQLQVEYTQNKSSVLVYDYDITTVTVGVTVRWD